MRLSQLAEDLEASAAVKDTERAITQSASMLRELGVVITVLREHLGELQCAQPPLNPEQLDISQLSQLDLWLQAGDYRAVGEFRRVAPILRHRFGASVADIGDALSRFDYERALMLLRRLPAGQEH